MIGIECCTYVPDYNASLSEIIAHIKHIANEVHTNDIKDPFEWLETMTGRWGMIMIRYVFVGIICLIFLAMIVTCIRTVCKTITTKVTTRMMIQRVPPTSPAMHISEELFYETFDELCKMDVL